MSAEARGEDFAKDGVAGGVEGHDLPKVNEAGVGVSLRLIPVELRYTEAWREDLCVNCPGEGREAELFKPGINCLEGLGDGLFRRPFPVVTPALMTLVFRHW